VQVPSVKAAGLIDPKPSLIDPKPSALNLARALGLPRP
jgi:hypothetical protein